jgi:alanine dehydrogenase
MTEAVVSSLRSTRSPGTLLLKRTDIQSLLLLGECVEIVEKAFRLHAEGKALEPGLLHINSFDGEFHIKAGGLELHSRYFAVKVNGGFFQNNSRYGMPNIQGTIVLCNGLTGYPLAVMDSGEITRMRTGAATAVAAKYLARPESKTGTICGCGMQARVQMRALRYVLPIQRFLVWGRATHKAETFAAEMASELGIRVEVVRDLKQALAESDVCVSCTPARSAFLHPEMIPPGMFIAGIGADSPEKQELDPQLLCANTVVVDLLEQCVQVGEVRHAVKQGMTLEKVHTLGEILVGKKRGRVSDEQIVVFDSTGTAMQDVAAAAAVYEKAVSSGTGIYFDFFA